VSFVVKHCGIEPLAAESFGCREGLSLAREFHRRSQDRFGPFWRSGQITGTYDSAATHMNNKPRLWSRAGVRISLSTVVVNHKFGQPGQETNQVQPAAVVALTNRNFSPCDGI
jgi:hypothetical protein